jgi:adenylate cyclase
MKSTAAPSTASLGPTFLLLARGPQGSQQVSVRGLQVRVLGREGGSADLQFKDLQISRNHAEVWVAAEGDGLMVRRLTGALNRVFLLGPDGQFHDQHHEAFRVVPGQTFAIGSTYFTVQLDRQDEDPLPSINISFSPDVLRQARLPDTEARLQAILSLPTVLAQTTTEEALQREALNAVRANLPQAGLVALVEADDSRGADSLAVTTVQRLERPGQGMPPLSGRLVGEALRTGQAVLYHWDAPGSGSAGGTVVHEPAWAACLALGYRRRCLYVGGRSSQGPATSSEIGRSPRWQGDLKFLELVGSLLGSLLSARDLQARHVLLQGFLPPPVLAWLETMSVEEQRKALAPRTVELTVMFCDLAGFSRLAERFARTTDAFWETVQHALSVMTQSIREQEGVVVDFQGDSVLAIWGWPETSQTTSDPATVSVRRAARAALNIQARFPEVQASFDDLWRRHLDTRESSADPPTLRCGVALTTGPVLVGYLGTAEMGGVDVFGHTVNRAARVQGLTRLFHAPILLDEVTAQRLGLRLPGWCRIDPLLRVRLAGMEQEAAMISQLSLVEATDSTVPALLTPEEQALFETGNWMALAERIRSVTLERGFRLFVLDLLHRHNFQPPADWSGVYIQTKGD